MQGSGGIAKIEAATSESVSPEAATDNSRVWWLFCAVVVAIKLLLVWIDPTPKLFMGDSGSYIWTALTGWIPPDRSYIYGYLVRWLAVWPHSLTPLLVAQALASAVTAILFAIICNRFFEISNWVCFSFGLLCALDPCQLIWERYVMTETFSLLVYMLVLYSSFLYVRDRCIWELGIVQALFLLLIGFRMSYLVLVQVCAVLLPVIAFVPCALVPRRDRSKPQTSRARFFGTGFAHIIVSIALMFVLHASYKQVNGWLNHREPAYLYDTGAHLAAVWAPALRPSDATDPRFGELIANGYQFEISNRRLRNAQQFGDGFLIDRWSKIESDVGKRDRVARETAINALCRRPLQIAGLAVQTYIGYWGIASIQWYARKDLGYGALTDDQVKTLAEKFGFRTAKPLPARPLSFIQRYFVSGWPYYFIIIISPLTCAFAMWLSQHRTLMFLLFVHAVVLMIVVTALSPQPSIRYLQPVSVLTLFSIAICVDRIARSARQVQLKPAS